MNNVVYLILRRMRVPLIVVITTYAISVLGLVLIPGVDDQGNPWRMDFFHATYFVSFLGSTIGLGEIPYPFTPAQRMWTTVVIYAAVVSWLYAIGSILTLIQDRGFRQVLAHSSFTRRVRALQEPFFIVCGYGDAGSWLVREFSERGISCVVVDRDEQKALYLEVEDLPANVPGLHADATDSASLVAAGLTHPSCCGVIGLTGSDHSNLAIAVTSKLLAPQVPVFCQSESKAASANMASFGTDYIIDPFETFAARFAMMVHSPSMYLVYEWMTAVHNAPLTELRTPPAGLWILCGFGRFGKALREHLSREGVEIRLIEADIEGTRAPRGTIAGAGTEADTLLQADVRSAAAIVAGTDNDTNNLSIVITARDLNPALFTVARQNQRDKDAVFRAAAIDLVMQPSSIAAQQILGLVLAPLLEDFLRLAGAQDEAWANVLVSRVAGVVEDVAPEIWDLDIAPHHTPAVFDCLLDREDVMLKDICSDPRDRTRPLPCVALLLKRDGISSLLPAPEVRLRDGDQLLFCGLNEARHHMHHLVRDHQGLQYTRTGVDRPTGTVWRWLSSRRET